MLADNNERAGIEERYDVACANSGSRDVIGAAGMAQLPDDGTPPGLALRTGMALLRLHSEWTGAAKPSRLSPEQVEAIAARIRAEDALVPGRWGPPNPRAPKPAPALVRARAEAARWYANELTLLSLTLKSRATVWELLLPWSMAKEISEAEVAQALFYWLDPVCGHCGGHGLHKVKDAPALSAKQCRACNGTGTKHIPEGCGRVLSHISHCTSQARTSIGKRLQAGRS